MAKKAKKSWREKLADDKDLPKIGHTDSMKGKNNWGVGSFVVPAPTEVDALMKKVPKGRLATTSELRKALASKHQTDFACPLTTGIFTWIAANAAAEDAAEGKKRITPYWRTLKKGGELNPKFPGGVEETKRHLESEGHTVTQRGKRFFVAGYEDKLVTPTP